jgi:hypothetical protein
MFAGLILSGVLGAASQQLPPSTAVPVPQTSPPVSSPAISRPEQPGRAFSRLFQAQPEVKPQPQPEPQPQVRARQSRTKVVCGMTLILVGPETDPNMPKQPPKDGGVRYTMRRYPPPACGQNEQAQEKKR